jgi:hypothetical protein
LVVFARQGGIVKIDPLHNRVAERIAVKREVSSLAVTPRAIYFVHPDSNDPLRADSNGRWTAGSAMRPGSLESWR